jgi:hypothetical protein
LLAERSKTGKKHKRADEAWTSQLDLNN